MVAARTLARTACWFLSAAAVAGLAWWYWPTAPRNDDPASPRTRTEAEGVREPPGVEAVAPPLASVTAPDAVEEEPEPTDARFWEAVRRSCPWPPEPSAWRVLDERCLSVMNRRWLDEEWRHALAVPLETRRAVVAALDNPECHVPVGERRPDLYAECGAEAMVGLALLQRKCVRTLGRDWERIYRSRADSALSTVASQDEYYRWVDKEASGAAWTLWEVYMCRTVPPEALEWIEALPTPRGDPTSPDLRLRRIPHTQQEDLYAAARRLGATVPDWVPDG